MSVPIRRHDEDDDGPLSVPQAARRLDTSTRAVRKLIERGTLRATKVNRRWKIRRRSVEQVIERRRDEAWEGVHERRCGRERTRWRERR